MLMMRACRRMMPPAANEGIVVEMPRHFFCFFHLIRRSPRGFFASPQPSSLRGEGFFGFAEWKMRSAKRLLLEEKLAAKLTDEVARKMRSVASIFG